MALTAGTKINQYSIVARLGSGGMGEVYLAQGERLRRKVALKLLFRWEIWNRKFRDVPKSNEHGVQGRFDYKPWKWRGPKRSITQFPCATCGTIMTRTSGDSTMACNPPRQLFLDARFTSYHANVATFFVRYSF